MKEKQSYSISVLLSICIAILLLLSGCEIPFELPLPEVAGELSESELTGAVGLSSEESSILREYFAKTPGASLSAQELSKINTILGEIHLERTPGELPKLYIKGNPKPFAEVYAERGEFKMLDDGKFFPTPNTILSVEGNIVNIRSNAQISNSVIRTTVQHGDLLLKLAERDGWYQVRVIKNNVVYNGWINGLYVLALNSKKEAIANLSKHSINDDNLKSALACTTNKNVISSLVINEKFLDNRYNWVIESNNRYKLSFNNNGYEIDNFFSEPRLSLSGARLNMKHDYDVVAKLRHISGCQDCGYGVVFNFIDSSNFYLFSISANGEYRIVRYEEGILKILIPWTFSETINRGDNQDNFLTIEQCDEYCLFIINFKAVAAVNGFVKDGNEIGFFVDDKQSAVFNGMVVRLKEQKTW